MDNGEERNNSNDMDKVAKGKKLPKGSKRRMIKNLKKRNPAQFLRNKRDRKRKKRLNMGDYIKNKIRAKIKNRLPINKVRKNLRSKFKRNTGLKSLKKGGLLTAPEILVGLVPKIDVIDETIVMAYVHSVSPMTGMVTFVTEHNRINSLPLEVFLEIATPMSDDHADSLAMLIFAEMGDLELLPVSRQDILDCTAELLTKDQQAQCTEIAQEHIQKGLGADKGVRNRVKSEPDEMNRLQRFYQPFNIPYLQEPVMFGGVLPLSEMEEDLYEYEEEVAKMASRIATFYREQQHPSKMDKKDDKSSKGTPSGDDDSSTMSSPGWVTPQTGAPYNQDTPSHKPTNGIVQPAVYDNPGSAKVIPSGRGFVNNASLTQRVAWRYLNER